MIRHAPKRSVARIQGGRLPRKTKKVLAHQAMLVEVANAELKTLGAVPSERPWLDGELNLVTKAGLLRCHVYDSAAYVGIWIAFRFEDVDRACALLNPKRETCFPLDNGLNPYSGKWNLDSALLDVTDPDDVRRHIRLHLAKVLP